MAGGPTKKTSATAAESEHAAEAAFDAAAEEAAQEAALGSSGERSRELVMPPKVAVPGEDSVAANDADATSEPLSAADATLVSAIPEATNSIVPPPKENGAIAGVVQGSRRWIFIAKHYAWTSVRSPRWWFLVGLVCVQIGAVAWPLWKLGWASFLTSFATLLSTQVIKMWKENQPKTRHIVDRNYDERKLAHYKLIHAIQSKELMTPPEVQGYQRDALALIGSYVRDHRRDWSTPTIFANLLVEDGDELEVVARDRDHRQGRARYKKAGMLCTRAFLEGSAVLTGDVYRDYPETPAGKPYFSVLAIPVYRDEHVVGVVSIDSSQKFHFDLEGSKLVDYLMPYVALLAWTLPKGNKGLYLPGRG